MNETSQSCGGVEANVNASPCHTSSLQPANDGWSGAIDVVLGFDFGTSSSKCVIRLPDLPGSPGYAVEWGKNAAANAPCLLPTAMSIQEGGLCSLSTRGGGSIRRDIKLRLLELGSGVADEDGGAMDTGPSAEVVAVAYLALAMKQARLWLLLEKQGALIDYGPLRWALNLGIPSECTEESSGTRVFRRVGRAAWWLSTRTCEVTIPAAQAAWARASGDLATPGKGDPRAECDLSIVPEIAGAAAGYARSQARRPGLHLMLDVGASTLDIVTFSLADIGRGDQYALLTTDVQLLGTMRLQSRRLERMGPCCSEYASALRASLDPLDPLPDMDKRRWPECGGCRKHVQESDRGHARDCWRRVMAAVIHAKVARDPFSEAWGSRGRLPVILSGGGVQHWLFAEVPDKVGEWMKSNYGNAGIDEVPALVPERVTRHAHLRQRLAVAWGLSYTEFDIGEVVPVSRVEDAPVREWTAAGDELEPRPWLGERPRRR